MKNLFIDTRLLDKNCIASYGLTEDIMMENAASALEKSVLSIKENQNQSSEKESVLIVTGSGNNGGDGMVLARRLESSTKVFVYCVFEPKSPMCVLQYERAKKLNVQFIKKQELDNVLENSFAVVDCIYGSGFHGKLDEETANIILKLNNSSSYKIACDISSGIDCNGIIGSADSNGNPLAFKADKTITMGALKTALYSDFAKDFCGIIECAKLGISNENFEKSASICPEAFLLEKTDINLPKRQKNNVNKGSFGHASIVCGEKTGAAIIASNAAFAFGAGLVTLVHSEPKNNCQPSKDSQNIPVYCPAEIMQSNSFPQKTTSIAVGMGLGIGTSADLFLKQCLNFLLKNPTVKCVLDADVFSSKEIVEFLNQLAQTNLDKLSNAKKQIVLTPHPKEFQSLLKLCGFGEYSVQQIVQNKIALSKEFVKKYPNETLLVKGSNVCITHFDNQTCKIQTFINPYGKPCLAKGGSGDILSGLIASLLAQGYSTIEATKTASLVHAAASEKIQNDFGMTPDDLIQQIKNF